MHLQSIWTRGFVCWDFTNSPFWYGRYIQAVIMFQGFLQSTQRASLYYFRRIYTMWFLPHLFCHPDLFISQKFCVCADNTNLVPNQSHDNFWRDGVKQWSDVLHKERFISISISRFLFFFQLQLLRTYWVLTSYFVILKILSLFGRFQFWAATRFREVICPR